MWVSSAGFGNLTPTTLTDPCASRRLRPARLALWRKAVKQGDTSRANPQDARRPLSVPFSHWYSLRFAHVRREFQTQRTRTCVLAGTSVRDQICRCGTRLAEVL